MQVWELNCKTRPAWPGFKTEQLIFFKLQFYSCKITVLKITAVKSNFLQTSKTGKILIALCRWTLI